MSGRLRPGFFSEFWSQITNFRQLKKWSSASWGDARGVRTRPKPAPATCICNFEYLQYCLLYNVIFSCFCFSIKLTVTQTNATARRLHRDWFRLRLNGDRWYWCNQLLPIFGISVYGRRSIGEWSAIDRQLYAADRLATEWNRSELVGNSSATGCNWTATGREQNIIALSTQSYASCQDDNGRAERCSCWACKEM